MKKRILVIDDEPSILELLQFVLGKDYHVDLKSNGYEAITWLTDRNLPDLIILDIEMPVMNAPDFLSTIKVSGMFRDIPVIILSVRSDEMSHELITTYPDVCYMAKPFNPAVLKKQVDVLLKPFEDEPAKEPIGSL